MTQEQRKTWVDLSKSGRLYSTRSDIPGIQNKNSNKGWYGVILCKDEKNPIENNQSNCTAKDRDDDNEYIQYSKDQDEDLLEE